MRKKQKDRKKLLVDAQVKYAKASRDDLILELVALDEINEELQERLDLILDIVAPPEKESDDVDELEKLMGNG